MHLIKVRFPWNFLSEISKKILEGQNFFSLLRPCLKHIQNEGGQRFYDAVAVHVVHAGPY